MVEEVLDIRINRNKQFLHENDHYKREAIVFTGLTNILLCKVSTMHKILKNRQ